MSEAYDALFWISDGTMCSLMREKTGIKDNRYDAIDDFRIFVIKEAKELDTPNTKSWLELFNRIDFTKYKKGCE